MSSDHERLFDIGGLAGPRNEDAEGALDLADTVVGLVHVMHACAAPNDQDQVLGEEQYDSVLQMFIGDPDRGILGDPELSRDNGQIDRSHLMRELGLSDSRAGDGDLGELAVDALGVTDDGKFAKLLRGGRDMGRGDEPPAHELEGLAELVDGIGIGGGILEGLWERGIAGGAFSQPVEDSAPSVGHVAVRFDRVRGSFGLASAGVPAVFPKR